MRQKTTNRYIAAMLCYLAFLLRIELGKIQTTAPLKLELPESNAAAALLETLRTKDEGGFSISIAIHRLLLVTLRQLRSNPFETTPCTFALFLIFKNTAASGAIKPPEEISSTISELKWPLRAAGFHEIVLKLKEAKIGLQTGADWQSDAQHGSAEGESPILK
jgi:hypothetical protein